MNAYNELSKSVFLKLNTVYRFSNTKLIERESTAEHTMYMQLIALHLYNKYPFIDINDLIMRILCHDLDECVLCDIPRDIKYHSKESLILINNIADEKLISSGMHQSLINRIHNSKHDGSTHGALTQVLDVLQCLLKVITEYKLQNTSIMHDKLTECLDNYKDALELFYDNVKDKNDWINVYEYLNNVYNDCCRIP